MNKLDTMPLGIVPGVCWISQRIREHFQKESSLEVDTIEQGLQSLDEGLSEMMNSVEETEDETASSLWATCEKILEALFEAWEQACESYLNNLGSLISRAYELLQSLEQKLSDDYALALSL